MASNKPNKSVMAPGKTGTHAPKSVEKAQHRSEAIADSAWPDRSYTDGLRSKQAPSKYPPTAVHSDNTRAAELLKPQYGYRKPDIMR